MCPGSHKWVLNCLWWYGSQAAQKHGKKSEYNTIIRADILQQTTLIRLTNGVGKMTTFCLDSWDLVVWQTVLEQIWMFTHTKQMDIKPHEKDINNA